MRMPWDLWGWPRGYWDMWYKAAFAAYLCDRWPRLKRLWDALICLPIWMLWPLIRRSGMNRELRIVKHAR